MTTVKSINPYSGKIIESHNTHSKDAVKDLLNKAHRQFGKWKQVSFQERKKLMLDVAKELKSNKTEYATLITLEMGKPISQAIAEVEKCAWVCEYYANQSELHLASKIIDTDADKSYISYEPLGIILAVMPWNYPFWQVFRFAAPSLMAGNVAVLKHASNVFGSALNIQKVFEKAGFPEHCFTTLLVGSDAVESIIESPYVKAVTLTGSGPAGAAVASIAGKNIKKTVLELGGSNALIVFKDADIEKTIESCIQARFQNTGQSCIAGKRLLIDESIADAFLKKLIAKVKMLKIGDPQESDTYIGVMAKDNLAEELELQLQESVADGAEVLIGGKRKGTYFEPTIVTKVSPEMKLFKEETFGPVLSVTTFKSEKEAISLSNNSKFGLGVSLFSKDLKRLEKLLPQFEEGAVFINSLVKSDPRLPFGGIKTSGYGRELSAEGIKEFVNIKTVYIKK
ncbi:MAG: NAD-dependent succinate-semialdehyde dehydrogenase [Flavobacteriaceae bacterium]|nr:NAD-dependent succinate-semialdehyde dehydrogenase [Flavobacteriaceae bacterium]